MNGVALDLNYVYFFGYHLYVTGTGGFRQPPKVDNYVPIIEKRNRIDGSLMTDFGSGGRIVDVADTQSITQTNDIPGAFLCSIATDGTYIYTAMPYNNGVIKGALVQCRDCATGNTLVWSVILSNGGGSVWYIGGIVIDGTYAYVVVNGSISGVTTAYRYIYKINLSDGSTIGTFTQSGSDYYQQIRDIAIDSVNGYYYIVGDLALGKYSTSDGSKVWYQNFDDPSYTTGVCIAVDSTGVYVAMAYEYDVIDQGYSCRIQQRDLATGGTIGYTQNFIQDNTQFGDQMFFISIQIDGSNLIVSGYDQRGYSPSGPVPICYRPRINCHIKSTGALTEYHLADGGPDGRDILTNWSNIKLFGLAIGVGNKWFSGGNVSEGLDTYFSMVKLIQSMADPLPFYKYTDIPIPLM